MKIDFIKNLIFMYHTMVASENLLLQGIRFSRAKLLTDYYARHLKEERGHHKWLAEDLKSVGIDVARTQIPLEAVEMVGVVYYFIFHVDACALLGYMELMEGRPMALDKVAELEQIHGKQLCRTLRWHATHDVEHLKELQGIIGTMAQDKLLLIDQTKQLCASYLLRAMPLMESNDASKPTH